MKKISKHYYHIYSHSLDILSMAIAAGELAENSWLCKECRYPKRNVGVVDVTLQESANADETVTAVAAFGVPVIKRLFLDTLGNTLLHELFIGRVFVEDKGEDTDWATVRCKDRLIVRGESHVAWRVCPECNRNIYFAMGDRYLYPGPSLGCDIFESDLCGLILSEKVYSGINFEKWPELVVEQLPVLDTPRDGLPELIASYK